MPVTLNPSDLLVSLEYAGNLRRKAPECVRPLDRVGEVATFDAARLINERVMKVQVVGGRTSLEMYVAPGQSLKAAVEQAVAELDDPVDPPAFDDADEEALARFAMPLILARLDALASEGR